MIFDHPTPRSFEEIIKWGEVRCISWADLFSRNTPKSSFPISIERRRTISMETVIMIVILQGKSGGQETKIFGMPD
jgi:hypothetical protein